METVKINPEFLLRAVNLELTKVSDSIVELNRLTAIGYRNSQTGLDVALSGKTHLLKAYELITRVNFPMIEPLRREISECIGRQDIIIWSIEASL